MGWKGYLKERLESTGDWEFPTVVPGGGRMGGRRGDLRRWRKTPIKWVYRGDQGECFKHRRRGEALMEQLEGMMAHMDLRQGVLRRFVRPDVLIECDKRFGLRTVTITARGDARGRAREILRDCFANRTVALAHVLDVEGGYCTRGVRYTVAVCDGKGEYLLFRTKAASTDYTPWESGDQVLVMQHRTTDLPEDILTAASPDPNDDPYAGPPFTRTLAKFEEECVSILPWRVGMPKRTEYEIVR